MAKEEAPKKKPQGIIRPKKRLPHLEDMTPAQRIQFMQGYLRGHMLARSGRG